MNCKVISCFSSTIIVIVLNFLIFCLIFFFPFIIYNIILIEHYFADYIDVGEMDVVCQRCNAMFWYGERAQRRGSTATPDASICCMKGKITLPSMIEPPPLLRSLFNGGHPKEFSFYCQYSIIQ